MDGSEEDSMSYFHDNLDIYDTSRIMLKYETIQHENLGRTTKVHEVLSSAASKQMKQCRLCLSSLKKSIYEPIISKHSNYALSIFLISGVKVIENRENPSLICQKCSSDLKVAHQIRRKCLNAEKFFQKVNLKDSDIVTRIGFIDSFHYENIKIEPSDSFKVVTNVTLKHENDESCEDEDSISQPEEAFIAEFKNELNASSEGSRETSRNQKPNQQDPAALLTCGTCGCTKSTRRLLNQHIRRVHLHSVKITKDQKPNQQEVTAPLICDTCGCTKSTRRLLHQHIRRVHRYSVKITKDQKPNQQEETAPLICNTCGCTKSTQRLLNQHIRRVHLHSARITKDQKPIHQEPVAQLICDICGYLSSTERLLKQHIRRVHLHDSKSENSAVIRCSLCNKRFMHHRRLWDHEIVEHNKIMTNCECDVCGFSCKVFARMREHISRNHKPLDRTHVCSTCGKIFKQIRNLRDHEDRHSSEAYPCHLCPKTFESKRARQTHITGVHERTHRIPCQFEGCKVTTTNSSHMKRHCLYAHSVTPKTFECPLCPWKFRRRQGLIQHSRVHTGEKRFKCLNEGCTMAYGDSRGLAKHRVRCEFSLQN